MLTPRPLLNEDRVLRLQQRTLTPSIILTAVLAMRVFLAPITPDGHLWIHPVNQAVFAAALVYMAATTRRHLLIAGTLGICGVTLELAQLFSEHLRGYEWLQFSIFVTLLVYAFWLMIKDLFTAKKVDATILLLAVNCAWAADGLLDTERHALVTAPLTAPVVEMAIKTGDRVEAGQVLVRMDVRAIELEVEWPDPTTPRVFVSGEDVSDADVRVAAASELYESALLVKYLSFVDMVMSVRVVLNHCAAWVQRSG